MPFKYPLFVMSSVALASCASADAPAASSAEPAAQPLTLATAALKAADGSERGLATLTSTGGGIELRVSGLGLPPGEHGAHLHTVGRCDAPDFTSAGPHLNPHGKQHGTQNPMGSHLGDLPNLTVAADGAGTLVAPVSGTPAEVEASVFDADGTAIVIHATADDYKTDPSGNSGGRIACGILTKPD